MKQNYLIFASVGAFVLSGVMLASGSANQKSEVIGKKIDQSLVEAKSIDGRAAESVISHIPETNDQASSPKRVTASTGTPNYNIFISNPEDITDIKSYIEYICDLMSTQYQDLEYMSPNGEAYINHRMNDAFGPDQLNGASMLYWGAERLTGSNYWDLNNGVLNNIVWVYCYNMIYRCNLLLENLESKSSLSSDEQFIKAQALTMRAHAYTKLVQYFAPRWENSDGGNAVCAVQELKTDNSDHKLLSMKETADIIYNDLDDAIHLYTTSGLSRAHKWNPDKSVAQGIYARIAMVIHDYQTAQKMAHNAGSGYNIMDNDTYLGGFYKDNDDFMWMSDNDYEKIYYYGEFNWQACNGTYTEAWDVCDAIDMDLVRQLDPNDIRLKCFLTPDKIDIINEKSSDYIYYPSNLTGDAFWNNNFYSSTDGQLSIANGPIRYPALNNYATYYSLYYYNNIFTGDKDDVIGRSLYGSDKKLNYILINKNGKVQISIDEYATLFSATFGAQYKFWSNKEYSSGHYPFMRSAEMKLLEAEAAYHNGDESTARTILNQINSIRIPGYNFTGSGSDLLDEIRLCRRIELWGEGHNWTDFKRWNLPIQRRAWVDNDPTSGNWPSIYAIDTPVDANNGWKMAMPIYIGNLFGANSYFLPIGKNSEFSFTKSISCNLISGIEFDLLPVKGLDLKKIEVICDDIDGLNPEVRITKLDNGNIHVIISEADNREFANGMTLVFDFVSDGSLQRGIMTAHNISYTSYGQIYFNPDEKVLVTGYDVTVNDISMKEEEQFQLPAPISNCPDGVSYEWDFNGNEGYSFDVSDDYMITALRTGDYPYILRIKDPLLAETNFGTEVMAFFQRIKILSLPWGDADDSGYVDVADIVTLIKYLNHDEVESFNEKYADANRDGVIDEKDISTIANIILDQPYYQNATRRKDVASNDPFSFSLGNIEILENGIINATLYLTAQKDYSALQTDLILADIPEIYSMNMLDNFNNHEIAFRPINERTRVLIYSLSLDVIPAGEKIPIAIITLRGNLDDEVSFTANSKASDSEGNLDIRNDADALAVSTLKDKNSIFRVIPGNDGVVIVAPDNAVGNVYDIWGRIQAETCGSCSISLNSGIYIVRFRDSNKVHKIIVK